MTPHFAPPSLCAALVHAATSAHAGLRPVGVGGSHTSGNMNISGGVRYVDIGDAVALGGASAFNGNSALAIGVKIGFTF